MRFNRRDLISATVGLASAGAAVGAFSQNSIAIPASSRELWQWVKTQPVLEAQIAYLDVASAGPTLRAAMAAEYRARELQSLGLASTSAEGHWATESTRQATRFASFMGCDAEEIMFTRGAGEALSTVAYGLDLNPGDEVLTTTREHPAFISPWLALARSGRTAEAWRRA